MSTPTVTLPPERWRFSRPKLYGWLAGVGLMVFGGLLCSVPVGVLVGVPAAGFGAFLAISFALAMSWAPLSVQQAIALVVVGLVLLAVGRWAAPLEAVAESFRAGTTLVQHPGPLGALGVPMMLVGMSLFGLAVPWVREGRPFGLVRGPVALTLINGSAVALLFGALLLRPDRPLSAQPVWLWVGSTLAAAAGTGLRCRFHRLAWPTIMVLTALTLPATWGLLLLAPRPVAP
jgi:hypothetical protein